MKPAEEWAREWLGDSTEVYTDEVTALITAARREGAEDMRERAAATVDARRTVLEVGTELSDRIRALPLPNDDT